MMSIPARYVEAFANPRGPGDSMPTALQILKDEQLIDGLRGKTVLITGGNEGCGLEAARALHMTGAKIFITTRSSEKSEAAVRSIKESSGGERGGIESLTMQLDDLESVKATAHEFLQKSDRLDILVCIAGGLSAILTYTKQHFESTFGVSYLAHFLLFLLLQPLLLRSSTPTFNSRVVMVASSSHRRAKSIRFHDLNHEVADEESQSFFWRYGHSKLATIYMANEIERLYGMQGLHAWSLDPGGMMSATLKNLGFELALHDPYMGPKWRNAEQGAATPVWAAVSRDLEGKGGRYLENVQEIHPFEGTEEQIGDWAIPGYSPQAYNEEQEKKLWTVGEEMVAPYLK